MISGEEHEDVVFGGDKQSVFAASVADLGGVVHVFHFDANGEAFAADGGFPSGAHLREPCEEVLAEFGCVLDKLIAVARQIAEVGKGGSDRAWVPAVGGIWPKSSLIAFAIFEVVITAPRPP